MVDKVINPTTFRLELPPFLNIHTICYVSFLKLMELIKLIAQAHPAEKRVTASNIL